MPAGSEIADTFRPNAGIRLTYRAITPASTPAQPCSRRSAARDRTEKWSTSRKDTMSATSPDSFDRRVVVTGASGAEAERTFGQLDLRVNLAFATGLSPSAPIRAQELKRVTEVRTAATISADHRVNLREPAEGPSSRERRARGIRRPLHRRQLSGVGGSQHHGPVAGGAHRGADGGGWSRGMAGAPMRAFTVVRAGLAQRMLQRRRFFRR